MEQGKKSESSAKLTRYVERKPLAKPKRQKVRKFNIKYSEREILRDTLNKRFAGKVTHKGKKVWCNTANYIYKVKVEGYNKYKPVARWEIL